MRSLLFRIWFKSRRLCTGEQTHIVGVNPTRSFHNVGQFLWSVQPERGHCGSDSALLWLCSCLPSPCLRQQMALLTEGGRGGGVWGGLVLIWQGNALKRDRWLRWLILKRVSIKADGDASVVTFLDTVVCSAVTCSCFYSNLRHSLSAMSSTTSPLQIFPHQWSLTDYLPVNLTWSQWEARQICNITTQLMIQN